MEGNSPCLEWALFTQCVTSCPLVLWKCLNAPGGHFWLFWTKWPGLQMNSCRPMKSLVTKPNHTSHHIFQGDVGVCVWFQINAVRRIWGWIYSFNIVAQKTLRSGGDTAQGWYFASHRLPSFLWQVSTLETASVDMYHFVHGTTHFTKSSHYHCYLLAFLFNITMVSNSA